MMADRSGLPGWTYTSEALFRAEKDAVFLRHWQLAGHVADIPEPGDYLTFDLLDERALVIRGHDKEVRAFHNLCRHRGTRVVSEAAGRCNKALICPFHGWAYNLDGSLRGVAERDTFPPMRREDWSLKPVEMEIWAGFIFLRFLASDQPSVADCMAPHAAELAPYGLSGLVAVPESLWGEELDANWKSVRDVDNEGYHVRAAHPGLHDLYGEDYADGAYEGWTSRTVGRFNNAPPKLWSVRNYRQILPADLPLPDSQRDVWLYIGLWPNQVIALYPDSAIWYQEIPLGPERTLQRGRVYAYPHEDRRLRAARYLSGRIDRDTAEEDHMLCVWVAEATKSSAYDGVILSDLELGLKSHHDILRKVLPVVEKPDEPSAEEWGAIMHNRLERA